MSEQPWAKGDEGYVYRQNRWVKVEIEEVRNAKKGRQLITRLKVTFRTVNGTTSTWLDSDRVWRQDRLFAG